MQRQQLLALRGGILKGSTTASISNRTVVCFSGEKCMRQHLDFFVQSASTERQWSVNNPGCFIFDNLRAMERN